MNFLSLLTFILIIASFAITLVYIAKIFSKNKKKERFIVKSDFGFLRKNKSQQARSTGFALQVLVFLPIFLQTLIMIPWAFNFRQTQKWELHLLILGVHSFFLISGYVLIRLSRAYKWES